MGEPFEVGVFPTPAEDAILRDLEAVGGRYIVVGLAAAALAGADLITRHVDLWLDALAGSRVADLVSSHGGRYEASGWFVGGGLDRLSVATRISGLRDFDREYVDANCYDLSGLLVRGLGLDRVIASKRVADRERDRSVMPALEAALLASRALGKTVVP